MPMAMSAAQRVPVYCIFIGTCVTNLARPLAYFSFISYHYNTGDILRLCTESIHAIIHKESFYLINLSFNYHGQLFVQSFVTALEDIFIYWTFGLHISHMNGYSYTVNLSHALQSCLQQ